MIQCSRLQCEDYRYTRYPLLCPNNRPRNIEPIFRYHKSTPISHSSSLFVLRRFDFNSIFCMVYKVFWATQQGDCGLNRHIRTCAICTSGTCKWIMCIVIIRVLKTIRNKAFGIVFPILSA